MNSTLAEQELEQWEVKRKHNESILQTPDVSIIQYRGTPELPQGHSVENPDLSKVYEIEVDECSNREQCQKHNRCGCRLIFEKDTTTDALPNAAAQTNPKPKEFAVKNIGFVNEKLTEILIDIESKDEPSREEIKKTIVQLLKREERNPGADPVDEFIRVNRQTYSPLEVQNDRNGRTIYAPIVANATISFAAESK